MAGKTRKRQKAPSAIIEPPIQPEAKKRRDYNKRVDKTSLARAVLYLSPRYLAKISGQPQLSNRALFEEARLLLGVENSGEGLRRMFGNWRKAEGAKWEQMQEEADGDEEAYFDDLIEREEELKSQQGTATEDVRSAISSGPKPEEEEAVEATGEGETGAGKVPKREEESDDAQSNETSCYDLGDATAPAMEGENREGGGPNANQGATAPAMEGENREGGGPNANQGATAPTMEGENREGGGPNANQGATPLPPSIRIESLNIYNFFYQSGGGRGGAHGGGG